MKLILFLLLTVSPWELLESNSHKTREEAFHTLIKQAQTRQTSVDVILTCLGKTVNDKPQTRVYKRILYPIALKTIIRSNSYQGIPLLEEKQIQKIIRLPEPIRSKTIGFYALHPENNKKFIQAITQYLDEIEDIDLQLERILAMLKPGVLIERWEDHKLHSIYMYNFGELVVESDTEAKTLVIESKQGFIVKESCFLPHQEHQFLIAIPHRNNFPGIVMFAHQTKGLLDRCYLLDLILSDNKQQRLKQLTQITWKEWLAKDIYLDQGKFVILAQMNHRENSKGLSELLKKKDILVPPEYEFMNDPPQSHHKRICIYLITHGTKEALPGLYHWAKREKGEIKWGFVAMLAILQREYDQFWIDRLKKEKAVIYEDYPESVVAYTAEAIEKKKKQIRIFPRYKEIRIPVLNSYDLDIYTRGPDVLLTEK